MTETISAWENLGTDFSWIGPLTEWLRNLAIVVGVIVAWHQLGSWRREKVAEKRGELGEELVALVAELSLKISALRSPIGYGPPEGEEDDGTFDYRRRLQDLADLDDDFSLLRKLKLRQRVFTDLAEVDEAIEAYFEARKKLIIALKGKIFSIRGATRFGERNPKASERDERYDALIWEDGVLDEQDPIRSLVDPALAKIEEHMIPFVRLEVYK